MRARYLVGILLGLLFTTPGWNADSSTRIAIWRLKPLGLDSATAERLEVLLRAETTRLIGFSLQDREMTRRILAQLQNAQLKRCGGETNCLCGIGKVLKVEKLVTGVIGALGDDYTFDLKLVDIASCREERRINEALSGREDLLIGAIRGALYKLVVPELFVGSMTVEVPVKGAEVLVDDKTVGQTPLAKPISGLRPGSHKMKIRKEGYSSFEETIAVRFQQTTSVKVDLVTSALLGVSYEKEKKEKEPRPDPVEPMPIPDEGPTTTRILAWSSLGLTVAAAIVASIAGWRSNVAESELEQAVRDQVLKGSHQDLVDRGETWAMWSNIGWGITGGAAALTLVFFLVDWLDDDTSGAIRMAPAMGPDGAGLVLECTF